MRTSMQILDPLDGVLGVAPSTLRASLLQPASGLLETLQRRPCLRRGCPAGLRGRLAHRLRGLLQVTGRLLELSVVHLTGQALELARRLFRLFGQVALRLAASGGATLVLLGPPSLPLGLLLLPASQLLKLLEELVYLVVRLLLLAALHGLVLVLELVELELEEVGQIVRGLLSATTAAAAPALLLLRDVALVRLLGLLQVAQRFLLIGQRVAQLFTREIFLRPIHRFERLRQYGRDVPEPWIGLREPTVLHPLQKRGDLVLQAALRQPDAHHVLAELPLAVAVSLTDQVERRRDHLSLQLGEHRLLLAAATSTAAALLLGHTVGALEGAHVQEVDIAGDDLIAPERTVVAHDRVVRDQISGPELPLLEEERIAGRNFRERCPGRLEDGDGVLWTGVDRIDETDVTDAVVVRRTNLEVDLFYGGRGIFESI